MPGRLIIAVKHMIHSSIRSMFFCHEALVLTNSLYYLCRDEEKDNAKEAGPQKFKMALVNMYPYYPSHHVTTSGIDGYNYCVRSPSLSLPYLSLPSTPTLHPPSHVAYSLGWIDIPAPLPPPFRPLALSLFILSFSCSLSVSDTSTTSRRCPIADKVTAAGRKGRGRGGEGRRGRTPSSPPPPPR